MMPVKTVCAYCGVGCGVLATPDGKGGARIKGDPDHPANFGRLCSKGSALGETLDLEGRLLAPHIDGRETTWDTALDLVARKFSETIAKHGPDSVAFYVSGQLLTEDYYVANKLMKGFIGSANIDTNSRLCMASSVAGHKRAFGTDTVPGCYDDIENADLVVLVGSNLAWCHPVLHQRLMAAKDARGTKVVNIDPRRTATSEMADMQMSIKPGADVALFNGLLDHIVRTGAVDQDYIDQHVSGFDAAVAAAARSGSLAQDCGIPDDQLQEFYQLWTGTKKVVTIYSQGVNQSTSGTDKVNAIINCHLATGRIGRMGMGPFSVTGQPNAMGGREVGGLANALASHLDIAVPEHRDAVQGFWQSPVIADTEGLKAVEMFNACADGRIKAIWIMGTNPAVSLPRADFVRDALKKCDFVVVSDLMKQTDTTVLADVLLPAAGWGEKDGIVTNSERRMSRQRRFLPDAGAAKPDWEILCTVAKRMGFAKAFDFTSAEQVFAEYVALCAVATGLGKGLDLSDVSPDGYNDMQPVQWPVGRARFFAKGGFYTPSGKANMLALVPRSSPSQVSDEYPLILNTGRIRDQWHTMTRTGKSATLAQHIAEPFVQVNPVDAAKYGVKTADIVQITSAHGMALMRASVSEKNQLGQVFSPIHWTDQWAAKARISALVAPNIDPISGQPEFKRSTVQLKKYKAAWFGFAVSLEAPNPVTDYWATSRCASGWRVELADDTVPNGWETYARALFGLADAEAIVMYDKAAGGARVVFVSGQKILAALFVARDPVAVSRPFLSSALAQDAPLASVIAGQQPSDMPDVGATICSCFAVGVNTIVDAITTQNLTSIDEIGAALSAGTNCGSCRPELAALLAKTRSAPDFRLPN